MARKKQVPMAELDVKKDIVWIGSPNFGYPDKAHGRKGLTPKAIVLHIMQGTLANCDNWFKNPDARLSAHFGIGRKGEIHQYVATADAAWANGVVVQSSWKMLQTMGGYNPNLYTLSIEHDGWSGESDWTPEMVEADVKLITYLCKQYNIEPRLGDTIIGHNVIDSLNKRGCPGSKCPLDAIVARVIANLQPVDTQQIVDWRTKDIQDLGVAQAHEKTLRWILENSVDENARKHAQAALGGQWMENKDGDK